MNSCTPKSNVLWFMILLKPLWLVSIRKRTRTWLALWTSVPETAAQYFLELWIYFDINVSYQLDVLSFSGSVTWSVFPQVNHNNVFVFIYTPTQLYLCTYCSPWETEMGSSPVDITMTYYISRIPGRKQNSSQVIQMKRLEWRDYSWNCGQFLR